MSGHFVHLENNLKTKTEAGFENRDATEILIVLILMYCLLLGMLLQGHIFF